MKSLAMRSERVDQIGDRQSRAADDRDAVSIQQIAHELNSLLDGSRRCVSIAQNAIAGFGSGEIIAADSIIDRLETAQHGMRRIAELLQRAMASDDPNFVLFEDDQPLEKHVQRVLELLQPMAADHHVELSFDITPRAAMLRSGQLAPIILNGLRNAIESCAMSDEPNRRVELSIAINTREELNILISDTGAGLADSINPAFPHKIGGHGLGLKLCERIAANLGGELQLMNVPFGQGAVLRVTIPLRSIAHHG